MEIRKKLDRPPGRITTRIASTNVQKPIHHCQYCLSQKVHSVTLKCRMAGKEFEETFMVSSTMGNILIGKSFLRKYSKTLDISKRLVHFPALSLQLKNSNGKYKWNMCKRLETQKLVVARSKKFWLPCARTKTSARERVQLNSAQQSPEKQPYL